MNISRKNQSGFGLVETLLIIIVILLVGFISWFVWNSQKSEEPSSVKTSTAQKAKTPKASTKTTTTPQTASNSIKLAEIGVQIVNTPAGLTGSYYTINVYDSQPKITSAFFSTTSLDKLDSECSLAKGGTSIGSLTKHTGVYTSASQLGEVSPNSFVKQLDGYWISYGHPQAACSSKTDAQNLQLSQAKLFEDLVTNPANIEAL